MFIDPKTLLFSDLTDEEAAELRSAAIAISQAGEIPSPQPVWMKLWESFSGVESHLMLVTLSTVLPSRIFHSLLMRDQAELSIAEQLQLVTDRIDAKMTLLANERDDAPIINYLACSTVADGLKARLERLAVDPDFRTPAAQPDCFDLAADLLETPDAGVEFSVDISTNDDKDSGTARIFAPSCWGVNDRSADPIALCIGGKLEINPDGYRAMELRAKEVLGADLGVTVDGVTHSIKDQDMGKSKATRCGAKTGRSPKVTDAKQNCPKCREKRIANAKL